MISTRSLALVSILVAGTATACRSDGNEVPADGSPNADAPGAGEDDSIFDIQDPSGTIGIDAPVNLKGVVVVAIDSFGSRKGNFFVAEPAGGEYSGVLVFGAPLDQVDAITVGDLVDITGGVKSEFALTADTSGRTTTEIGPAEGGALTVTKTGDGTVPDPELVDGVAIAGMEEAAADAEWEKWEGVLIEVQDMTIASGVTQIGDDVTFLEFTLEGDLHIDNSLAEIPPTTIPGQCAHSVVGMGDYFFSHKILPRASSDVDISGTACGGIDTTTVAGIQTGTATGAVILENVIVTGVSFNRSNLWVQDAAAGAPNNGVLVYRGGSGVEDLPANIEVGAVVNIAGTVSEYMELTELTSPTVTFVSAPAGAPTPASVAIADLLDVVDGEPYEGVYVEIDAEVQLVAVDCDDVDTDNICDVAGFVTFTVKQPGGADTLSIEDTIHRGESVPTPAAGCATIKGIFGTNTFDPVHRNLLPVSAADLDFHPCG